MLKQNKKKAMESYENNSDINKKIKNEGKEKEKGILGHSERRALSTHKYGSYSVNTANIAMLKFDGLFLDISKYEKNVVYKNPFEGPSSFEKFYKVRQSKIKKKIISMTNEGKNDKEDN